MSGPVNSAVLAQMMKLKEMGGRIQSVNSKLCYVKFDLDGIQVEYAYGVNTVGKYFLERTKPYPLPLREFAKEARLMEVIEIDLEQFRLVAERRDMEDFVKLCREFHHSFQRFEDLCLYYDVEERDFERLKKKLEELEDLISHTAARSERVYFRKDPDVL